MAVTQLVLIFSIVTLIRATPIINRLDKCKILDMSYDFDKDTIYWPGHGPFKKGVIAEGITQDNFYYSAFNFCAGEHGGTHLDAPIHFYRYGKTTDQVSLNDLIGEACVVNVTSQVSNNRDYEVTQADLQQWEAKHGNIPDGCLLILHTGYGRFWPNKKLYLGTDVPGDVDNLHFPGISPLASQWLVDNRKIKLIAIDAASFDSGASKLFLSHRILLGQNISAIENLRNVDKLPARGATLVALPMKIKDGSGGPVRVLAVGWNGEKDPCRYNNSPSLLRIDRYSLIFLAFLSTVIVQRLINN